MRWTAIFATLALIPTSASAEEPAVRLKQAPGVDVVTGQCGACHSLDYIVMNSPFLDAGKWDAEVAKMIKAFGAPIVPADAKTIGDYLKQNYGGEAVTRKSPLIVFCNRLTSLASTAPSGASSYKCTTLARGHPGPTDD